MQKGDLLVTKEARTVWKYRITSRFEAVDIIDAGTLCIFLGDGSAENSVSVELFVLTPVGVGYVSSAAFQCWYNFQGSAVKSDDAM